MPMVGENLMLGIVERAPVALAPDLPRGTRVARLNDLIVAREDDGQELRRLKALRSPREAKAVHLGGTTDPAGQKHAVA